MSEVDNRCGGPFNFRDVVFNNVTIKGSLTLDDIGWLCQALGPCIDDAVAALNITAPPVDLTAGGVLTGTLGNAHLNASVAASELQGQEFVNITLSGGTTLNGNLSVDATAKSDVVALTSRYAGHGRGGVINPGVPINVSDLMLRYDELAYAINGLSGLWLRQSTLSGNISFIDDGAQQSITGLFSDCNGTPHTPNATIPTCDQMYAAIGNISVPSAVYRFDGYNRGGTLRPGVLVNTSDLMLRYDGLPSAIAMTPWLSLSSPSFGGNATDPIRIAGNVTFWDDAARQSFTGLLNDCNGTPHVPNATIPTCAQMAEAIANVPSRSARYLKRTVLAANGTFTASSTQLRVRMVSGGSGGGGMYSTFWETQDPTWQPVRISSGAGGTGGAYAEIIIYCAPGDIFTATIGAGGAAGERHDGLDSSTPGGAGGATRFELGGFLIHVHGPVGGGPGGTPYGPGYPGEWTSGHLMYSTAVSNGGNAFTATNNVWSTTPPDYSVVPPPNNPVIVHVEVAPGDFGKRGWTCTAQGDQACGVGGASRLSSQAISSFWGVGLDGVLYGGGGAAATGWVDNPGTTAKVANCPSGAGAPGVIIIEEWV